jgi:hypothetical protein
MLDEYPHLFDHDGKTFVQEKLCIRYFNFIRDNRVHNASMMNK